MLLRVYLLSLPKSEVVGLTADRSAKRILAGRASHAVQSAKFLEFH